LSGRRTNADLHTQGSDLMNTFECDGAAVIYPNALRNLKRTGRWPAMLAIALQLTACASLPDISGSDVNALRTATSVEAFVPTAKSNALVARRLQQVAPDIKQRAALEEAATGVPLIAGNKVTLLFDGPQTMTAMLAAISAAKNHVHLETYIFDQDEIGQRFASLLIEKQKQGVEVSILYDSVGTLGTPQEFFERMRQSGIRLIAFNPVNPTARFGHWELNNRDHRKLLIVDGKLAFTGGVNISSTYARSSLFRSRARADSQVGWRDTHIRIEGPAVAALQWAFLDTWSRQDGEDLPQREYFPALPAAGDRLVRVLATRPGGEHEIYRAYALAIQDAKTSIHITAAYFVPNQEIVDVLSAAARRGVDVKLVLPGVSDSGLVLHAGRAVYAELLAASVKLYELQIAVLHAKTAVIDGVWSTVGSTNLDMRSFLHNNELNVVILGPAFGAEMESAFAEDLRDSREITAVEWSNRPVSDRFKEWAAQMLNYWL
jgi:cardiolipin synthase